MNNALGRPRSRIAAVVGYLPERTLLNDELAGMATNWPASKILAKTGIASRHIADKTETAADLAFAAASKLFAQGKCRAEQIDFIILCTQAPDYILPTTACVLQHRLGIPKSAGALDINLGCSGFVYGLSLAKGLIETGSASSVLLLTADTYSKFIHPEDRSVRTLFGDGAAATLVVACEEQESGSIGPFVFGTDGSGAKHLMVEAGGFRLPLSPETGQTQIDSSGNVRSKENLFMDGAEVMTFSLTEVPKAVEALLVKTKSTIEEIDFFVFHQASRFMLDMLRKKMAIPGEKFPIFLEMIGNTVSSTIPLALENMFAEQKVGAGCRVVLVGFGVGYSWAAAEVIF